MSPSSLKGWPKVGRCIIEGKTGFLISLSFTFQPESFKIFNVKVAILFELFFKFFKIGIVGFGGGWAILPIIQREVVDNSHWLTPLEFNDLVAIAGSTPGPVAVNAATYIGFRKAGILGSFFATLGVITPPFIIIILISLALKKYINSKLVRYLLLGLKGAVMGLLLLALYSVLIGSLTSVHSLISRLTLLSITGFVLVTVFVFDWHPMLSLILSGVIGIALGYLGFFG